MACEEFPLSYRILTNETPPRRWYLTLFALVFVMGVIGIEIWPTEMPVWAFVVALLIGEQGVCVIVG
jgi:cyanate permease